MSVSYSFNKKDGFIIEDYDKAKTFASYLPGVADVNGIPMWSFYVNRGQCMGSFGVKNKDNSIMEFFPANTMYKNVELQGFRTFIKYNNRIHEIFSSNSQDKYSRRMVIKKNIFKIEEINESLNIKVTVTYFTMPAENFAAIVRRVKIENLDNTEKEIEILDGLAQVLPYGLTNGSYKSKSNLFRAWFDVYNLENNIAYYKLRATTSDSEEIGEIDRGNFYLSFSSREDGLISPIIDMDLIFGCNTSLTFPDEFRIPLEEIYNKTQSSVNKVSGGFSGIKTVLTNNFELCTIIGHISDVKLINEKASVFSFEYINKKEVEAGIVIEDIVENVSTQTSNHLFDQYIEQCYLDNILRGGYPLIFKNGDSNKVYHIYSRKHGDLEREYNYFSVEPAYYSQGNGNFRDINQNRRNDVLFNPQVKDFNVKQFMNLIQIDGYNPLHVKGSTFSMGKEAIDKVLNFIVNHKEDISKILQVSFTPGKLITYIVDNKVKISISKEQLLEMVIDLSEQNFEADFGEGYWSDHWTYNMDLIDSFLKIYPDEIENFIFEDETYRFFDSPVRILKRDEKYVITKGVIRQYGSIEEDKEKSRRLNISINDTNWLRTNNGLGEIYQTNLYVKLISLALSKYVTLDPYGIGIEMEGGKPGWNDAMNGLPGLFGSGISETAELKRMAEFVIEVSGKFNRSILLPEEIGELLHNTLLVLNEYNEGNKNDFELWDKVSSLRESYRDKVRFGISGKETMYTTKEIGEAFGKFNKKICKGLERALSYGNAIYPTYICYEAKEYEEIQGKNNPVNGYQNVKVKKFEPIILPMFLEGPARVLKLMTDKDKAEKLYSAIKKSNIYDKKMKMYKTSEPIDDLTNEIGRVRAFTAGWLERETVFVHMEYKYILGILKAGLYDEYFETIKTALIPFLDPMVYGRSTLENSSFIASSVNPDPTTHGRGYVARLTGAAAEVLSMWFIMMAGETVFNYEKEELTLTLSPVLPAWLFNDKDKVSFKFLGKTMVTYHNPKRLDTFGSRGGKINEVHLVNNCRETIIIRGSKIRGSYAEMVRAGEISEINAFII